MLFAAACCCSIGWADAAVRDGAAVNRTQNASTTTANAAVGVRSGAVSSGQKQSVVSAKSTATGVSSRSSGNTVSRATTTPQRSAITQSGTSRSATNTRTATTTARSAAGKSVVRSATNSRKTIATPARSARSAARATVVSTGPSNTFGTGYNACRDAYFTCMDQFCANQNETYRRCVCSSKLTEIQARERALKQSANQIQDFKDLNIEVIPKTGAEVKAMLSATAGESTAALAKDKSASAQSLAGISEVLTNTKSKSLSTMGTLDIAGDINAIWATTDLTSGANIANLTGEALYNAVHAQCVELISGNCSSTSTLNMVVSAYGMYIENDCTTLTNALDKKLIAANSTIRETERQMNDARLENYDAHNSTSINDCIAQVRTDITADTACGKDYVHCLDISGKYLNRDTGEPIYTADFYQLETQISLSGDVLTNPNNRMIVSELNRKREYAKRGLETCRDLSDEVWDEFMRQAVAEIYQGQQKKIREVKSECLDVVNACYDEQSKSLKDFSNIKEQLLIGSRLELSEEMCKEKLNACSNLYGDGNGNGLELLVQAMHNITDQKIAKECRATLQDYAKDMCSVPSNDSLHSYPYGCRVYAPGEQMYAGIYKCNQELYSSGNKNPGGSTGTPETPDTGHGYSCPTYKQYTSCSVNYYMATRNSNNEWVYNGVSVAGNKCLPCPDGYTCKGGISAPEGGEQTDGTVSCGDDYIGSLYQKMVRYAMQTCVRPTAANQDLPTTILEDVNVVMDSIRVDMAKSLSAECERLDGVWVDTQWRDNDINSSQMSTRAGGTPTGADDIHDITGHRLHKKFYEETGANTKWGYCTYKDEANDQMAEQGCADSGGTWDATQKKCTCASGKKWNSITLKCE